MTEKVIKEVQGERENETVRIIVSTTFTSESIQRKLEVQIKESSGRWIDPIRDTNYRSKNHLTLPNVYPINFNHWVNPYHIAEAFQEVDEQFFQIMRETKSTFSPQLGTDIKLD